MPSKKPVYIEGEAQARNIVATLADEIIGAELADSEVNRWSKAFSANALKWVTYKQMYRTSTASYVHNGKTYKVFRVKNVANYYHWHTYAQADPRGYQVVDATGNLTEKGNDGVTATGKVLQVAGEVMVAPVGGGEEIAIPLAGALLICVDDVTDVTDGKSILVLKQGREIEGVWTDDAELNNFKVLGKMTGDPASDWKYIMQPASGNVSSLSLTYGYNLYGQDYYMRTVASLNVADRYDINERYYVANPTHTFDDVVVLSAQPSVPEGYTQKDFFVMLKSPNGQYNYFDVYQGEGFVGTAAEGDAEVTYDGICDPSTVKAGSTPTIIDMLKAEDMYNAMKDGTVSFTAPVLTWAKDVDGVSDILSPAAHYFYGCDATTTWLANKKRRPDFLVRYFLSVTNDRVAMVIEGDPAPDMEGYYRSFGYFGKITPFNENDFMNNFAVTVGMGHLDLTRTGFVANDIKQDTNPIYSRFGKYTSNGMYSVSMLRTGGNVLFQAHYPALITQLPNYKGVGTIPAELKKLVLDKDGFQGSSWTDKYHASPIYLVHQVEGYRGYLDGVIAINNHNLVNLDELVVDTEELKDPLDPTKGTWTEVYKFFAINTPINFLKSSANPDEMTIAILKEVR